MRLYSFYESKSKMRLAPTFATCLLLLTIEPTKAFDLDGFYSGMTRAAVQQKLEAQGLVPKPINPIYPNNQIEAGDYVIGFCDDHLMFVSKTIGFEEFNALLVSMLRTNGTPKVDLPAMDSDILYLIWNTSDGEYRLNSGVSKNDGKRFHNIGELDNSVCKK